MKSAGSTDCEPLAPVDDGGVLHERGGAVRGSICFQGEQDDCGTFADRSERWRDAPEVIALVSALLALQEPDHFSRDGPVVHRAGSLRICGNARWRKCARSSGCPNGARTASRARLKRGPIGASRASAPGACRSRRFMTRRAKRSSTRRLSATRPISWRNTARTSGLKNPPPNFGRR